MSNYTRDYAFKDGKDVEAIKAKLDIEFDLISNAIAAVYARLAKTVNDDGTLRSGVIDGKAISKSVVLLPEEATLWAEGVDYKVGSVIMHLSSIRWCSKAHKSVNFNDEIENWEIVLDFKPTIDRLAALANNPSVIRVEKNIDAVQDLAKNIAPLLELRSEIDTLQKLGAALPLLKTLSQSGENTIGEIYENLDSLIELAGLSEKLNVIFEISSSIKLLSGITSDLAKLSAIAEDIKTVADFSRQLKAISSGVGPAKE